MSTWDLPSSATPTPVGWGDHESAELDAQARRFRRERKKQPTPRKRSTPVQVASGRWRIVLKINGVTHQARFDTYQQAIEWRDRHY